MKAALILYLFALSLYLANAQYNIQVTKILTEQVASDGFLVLETTGLNFPIRIYGRPNLNQFQLLLTGENNNTEHTLSCFVYQFEHPYSSPTKIGCRVRGLTPGRYSLNPLPVEKPINLYGSRQVTLLPFNVAGSFEITPGKEFYFYEYDENDEEFEYPNDYEDIDFDLFETGTGTTQEIYFDDIPVQCYLSLYKMRCGLTANMFPYERYHTYNVYLKDSAGNKKRNYFVLPVVIYMNF